VFLILKLLAQPRYEFRIGFDVALDFHQAGGERRFGGGEMPLGIFSGTIDECARGQHELKRRQGFVRVLRGAATHAAGIVGDDAADRAGGCACRIGAEAIAVREQREIGTRQDRAGPGAQPPPACFDVDAGPMPPDVDQNAIALRLAREAGTGSAERHALMLLPRIVEHFAHVIDVAGDHDRFGEEAIRTGVGGVANKIDGPSEHAVGAEERDEIIA